MRKIALLCFVVVFFVFYSLSKLTKATVNLLGVKERVRRRIAKKGIKKVLYMAAFGIDNAGYNYRVHKWEEILTANGFNVTIKRLVKYTTRFNMLTVSTNRNWFMVLCIWKRFFHIISSFRYDVVIVRREILLYNDYGNLFYEKLLLALHPNVVLDFDDNIGAAKKEPRNVTGRFSRLMMENGSKFNQSLGLYNRFTPGSPFLANMVRTNNPSVKDSDICILPTCVDYEDLSPKVYDPSDNNIVFGWIGSVVNLKELDALVPAFNELHHKATITLLVISGVPYTHPDAKFPIENRNWSLETQIETMKMMDIGIMPVADTSSGRGKCGFKLIQYMGLGIVGVASAVTINKDIIDDEVNGFLVTEDNWLEAFDKIIAAHDRLPEMGRLAKEKIESHYSFAAHTPHYLQFISAI